VAKFNILLLLSFLTGFMVKGQDTTSMHKLNQIGVDYIGFEIGGTGFLYSLNYERNFLIKKNIEQGIKIGISKSFIDGVDQFFIPIDYTVYLGDGDVQFLGGIGTTVLISPSAFPASPVQRADYRHLYQNNPSLALDKYGVTRYEQPFDLAYTARIGLRVGAKDRFTYFAYVNCFYIRFSMDYYFQPTWFSAGLSFRIIK
jgi:hypothetical protein